MLSDGHATYTPGLSENRGGTSSYYSNDRLGNLWTIDGSSKGQQTYIDFTGFGGVIAGSLSSSAGTTPFGFGGGNGCQTDGDIGLVLMGHRYYDTRIGRFISQDPIGDGTNWYAYCDNNPVNLTDPLGLVCDPFNSTGMGIGQIYDYVTGHGGLPGEEYETKDANGNVIPGLSFTVSGFSFGGQSFVAPMGSNINNDIAQARQFYGSSASRSSYSYGPPMHDTVKIGQYLIDHYHPGHKKGDPKIYGKQYDKYGHAIYGAAASELRLSYSAVLAGMEGAHGLEHGDLGEHDNGEAAGMGFDQKYYSPGPALYGPTDFVASGINYMLKKYGF